MKSIKELLAINPLFVFALEVEASNLFAHLNPLFIGVGKVNAAYRLSKQIAIERPSIIINLGSAGSNVFNRGEVVCCTQFIQRDMNAVSIGCELYATPFSATKAILEYGIMVDNLSQGICGTGDNFEQSLQEAPYNVVDMEAYPLAYIAQQENIPFICLKYISDGADDSAADEWVTTVKKAATALKNSVDQLSK